MRFAGKAVLITGGGTGMGRAAAVAFAREGARVAVNYRSSREAAEAVAAEIRSRGGEAEAYGADVADDAAVRAMTAAVGERFGGLDYLVNNAGWTTRVAHADMEALTEEIWERTLGTNLKGPFYCVRAAAKLMRGREGAAVVNVASMAAVTGQGSSMAYAASKAGVVTMTKSLARALAPEIRVNALCPGLVRTGFAGWTEVHCAAAEKITPTRRLATVEDVAEAVLFLAGAAGMTGETVQMDGGLTVLGPVTG
jgi:3-oxoacyl-[acyl-carrier protein] reductase